MSFRFLPLFAAAVSLLLAGCFAVSKNPLSTPANSTIDRRIEGVFAASGDDTRGNFSTAHFRYRRATTGTGRPERVTPSLEIVDVEPEKNGGLQVNTYRALTTHLGRHDYMSIAFPGGAGKSPEYMFFRYEMGIFGDLRLWVADSDVLKKAVRTGKLRGHVTHEKGALGIDIETLSITDSTEHLAAFVATSDPAVLFSEKPQVFHRITR